LLPAPGRAPPQLSLSSPLPQPVLPSALAGRRPRPPADMSDSEDDDDDDAAADAPAAARAAPRLAGAKQPRAAPAPQHPALTAAAKAVCEPSCGAPSVACSADSTLTVATDVASCGAFPAAAAAAAAAALRAPRAADAPPRPAATAPPELCRGDDECDCMGPPRSKRPRFGSAAALAMRRTQSVPRSLADMLGETEGRAAVPPAAPVARPEEF
jgi:hypothetical protein